MYGLEYQRQKILYTGDLLYNSHINFDVLCEVQTQKKVKLKLNNLFATVEKSFFFAAFILFDP